MGTLTGDVSRLPGQCDHKLPTSCRLTSIPQCCACADERSHAPSYPTYIDGIGFVSRGQRWQRYCWFCKGELINKTFFLSSSSSFPFANTTISEFWENRIAATNLRPSQTRIPEVPDQSGFLEKWYEFHQGYRTITKDDGSEERIAVLGEPFRDVSPGQLPRTLDELRAGRERSEADQQQHIHIEEAAADTGPSLDAELDQMFEAAAAEEQATRQPIPPPGTSRAEAIRVAGQVMQSAASRNREYQNRRIAALRRELHRMRNGIERVISGLRDLGELVPYPTDATDHLATLGRTLENMDSISNPSRANNSDREIPAPAVGGVYRDAALSDIQQRLNEAQIQLEQAQRFRDQSSREFNAAQASFEEARQNREEAAEVLDGADLDLADHRAQVSQLRREQRTADNYARVFGSREDMDNQGQDYVSPIGSMFARAWERFSVAEDVRRDERTLRQVLHDEQSGPGQHEDPPAAANTVLEDSLEEYYSMLRRQDWQQQPPRTTEPSTAPANNADGTTQSDVPTTTQLPLRPPNHLEHLLRNTPEPERSAIIARMRENGTAQALEESAPHGIFDLYRRLRTPGMPFRPGMYDREDDSDDEDAHESAPQGLDIENSGRPDPKEDDDMTTKLDCKICYTQTADTACLPCGHLVMCQWCSEQHSPAMQHDRTRPRVPANCPVCRKRIKQKVRIYRP